MASVTASDAFNHLGKFTWRSIIKRHVCILELVQKDPNMETVLDEKQMHYAIHW